jgi:hypothetical protein
MSDKIEKSLLDVDFAALTARKFSPSPAAWEASVVTPKPAIHGHLKTGH